MNRDLRDRLILPVALPLGLLAGIGVFVFSFSRILLAVEREVAVAIALATALDVLVIAALIANRKPDRPPLYLPLLGVSAVAVVGGGLFALRAGPPEEHEAPPPEAPALTIAAENIAFDKTSLELPGGGTVAIRFVNRDQGVLHNVAIYRDETAAEKVFVGELVTGPKTVTYTFPAPPPGTYFFRCDVHPTTMKGTVTVTGLPAEGTAPPRAAAGELRISAKNTAFDRTELDLVAGSDVVLVFRNNDAGVPHNVAIYPSEEAAHSGGQALFKGEIFNGVATRTYRFKAPPPGTYYFHCDVHPFMKGTVKVT